MVLSDYAKGVLSPVVIRGIVDMARARGLPVVVDPKTKDVRRYSGSSVLTPNRSEAAMITNFVPTRIDRKAAAKVLRDLAEVDAVVLTRGAQGITIYDPVTAKADHHAFRRRRARSSMCLAPATPWRRSCRLPWLEE